MKQNPITRGAFALTSIALAALALSSFATIAAADPAAPKLPDLTAGGEKDKSHDWLLGPTGLRGWMFYQDGRTTHARQILVTAVDKGSPADGVLAVGDVILGVGGKPFDSDARIRLANAITAAETRQGGGVLRLIRWRAGQTANVDLKLKVLGSYSDTAPYDCPKSKAIFEQGCELIAKGGLKNGDGMYGYLNMLALLASGKAEYRPLLDAYAKKMVPRMNLTKSGCWGHAYANLFLAEYVLATGDKEMLAELKRTTMDAVEAQSFYGTWGHGGRTPNGNCSGYGAMNQVGLPMTLSMVLAREAGVKDPALDKGIAKSVDFLRWYVDKGAVPYGVHLPWTASHDDNGKCSLAAVLFDVLGDREATAFFARMATAAYDEREQGHCGNWFNMMWALPGVSRCGPLATGAYLKEQSWYYDLARNWQGGFEYQKINPQDENNNYTGWDLTGTYLMSFGLPLKSLYVMGKKPSSVPPLERNEVTTVIAAGRNAHAVNDQNAYTERKTDELLVGLASWSPIVRKRSAQALAARKGECLPALLKMLESSDRHARYGAVEALGCIGPRADTAAPRLRALLKDPDPWLQSLASQAIRFLGPDERKASVDDLLRMAATANPADPRRTTHLNAGLALFSGYPGVGGPTLLSKSIEGVDRKLLYPAVLSLLENDDSVARGGPGVIFDKLSERDLVELLPAIVKAANEMPPTNEMFADGIFLAAADLLSKHHIREGMQLSVDLLLVPRWGMFARIDTCPVYLRRYGAHAKAVLPQLREMRQRRTEAIFKKCMDEIETTTEAPPLVSLQEFIAKAKAGGEVSTDTKSATTVVAGDAEPDRTRWFREARFGMFIHWGVYAVPAGEWNGETIKGIGEWIMRFRKIPVAKYKSFAPEFTAAKYDPEQWAALAARAGMKYVVITSKHHDGFALYDSAVTDWDVMTSGAKRDLLDPLAKAVRGRGMKFGLYYSQSQDWTHPGGATSGEIGKVWDPAQKGDYDEYLKTIALPQVREIIDHYDPAIVWWDTPMQMTPERVAPFAELMAKHPHIINNNRLGEGFKGDTMTPEQYIPPRGLPGKMFEVCMTMNDTWGYKKNDQNWKSSQRLIQMLSDISSKGGNLLLNIGPRADGSIPQESIDRLNAIARWMEVNSEAIHATEANPFPRRLPWGCVTQKTGENGGTTLYLHIWDWPANGKILLPTLKELPASGSMLKGGASITSEHTADGIVIQLPGAATDPDVSVACLKFPGPLTITQQPFNTPASDGSLTLSAIDADPHGAVGGNIRVEGSGANAYLTDWVSGEYRIEYRVKAGTARKWKVQAEIAATAPTRLILHVGDSSQPVEIPATGPELTWKSLPLGEIDLPEDETVIELKPQGDHWKAIHLRKLIITPKEG